MKNSGIGTKILKVLFILALLTSISLNLVQKRAIEHQDLAIEHLSKYKKGYLSVMQILNIEPRDAEIFLEKSNSK